MANIVYIAASLESVPENLAGKAKIVSGELKSLVAGLNKQGFQNLYVDGGRIVQGFLAEDLIDEMVITTVATVLGEGIPLFGPLNDAMEFRLEESQKMSPYLVQNRFVRVRS